MRELKRIIAAGIIGDILHIEGNFTNEHSTRVKGGWRDDPRIPGRRHDRCRAACARRIRQSGRSDPESERGRLFTEATTRPARRRGGASAIRERRDRRSRDRACRADVLADHGVRQQRLGGSPRGNDAHGREDWRTACNAGLCRRSLLGVLLEAFAETIETGKPFPVSTADMLDVVGAFEAIIRSMTEDRPISISRS